MLLSLPKQNALRLNKPCRSAMNQWFPEPTDESVGHITSEVEIKTDSNAEIKSLIFLEGLQKQHGEKVK